MSVLVVTIFSGGRDINQPLPSAAPLNLRPNPMFADIIAIESAARSRYHSLQLQFRQRLLLA
ncbi:MAG: hypothetical protein Ct9H300mP25_17640 [Acidobacteriota bacterium]|nr:MAG: hypothetical protein Ct9H300mP25_17640 [Acidobacteriota bacterium]